MKKTVAVLQAETSVVPLQPIIARGQEAFSVTDSLVELNPLGRTYGPGYDKSAATLYFYEGSNEFETSKQYSDLRKLVFSTDQFILNNINEAESERINPIYTFGTAIGYTAGEQPKVYVYQATLLINKLNLDSRTKLMNAYEKYGRASSALIGPERNKNPYSTVLTYRNRWIKGVLLSLDMTESSSSDKSASLTFSIFVFDERVI